MRSRTRITARDSSTSEGLLTPSADQEEDFKLFRVIENTIRGVLWFTSRWFYGLFLFLFVPWKLQAVRRQTGWRERLPRPLSFLAVACVPFSFLAGYPMLAFPETALGAEDLHELYLKLDRSGPLDLLWATVPLVIVLGGLLVLLSSLLTIRQPGSRQVVFYAFCLGQGASLTLFTAAFGVMLGVSLLETFSYPWIEWAWSLLIPAISLAVIILPGASLGIALIQILQRPRGLFLRMVTVALFSGLVFTITYGTAWTFYLSSRFQELGQMTALRLGRGDLYCSGNVLIASSSEIEIFLSLQHHGETPSLLKRERPIPNGEVGELTLRKWPGRRIARENALEWTAEKAEVMSWAAGQSSVLAVGEEATWVALKAELPTSIRSAVLEGKRLAVTGMSFQAVGSTRVRCQKLFLLAEG